MPTDPVDPAELPASPVDAGQWIPHARGSSRRYTLTLVDPSSGAALAGVLDADANQVRAYAWAGADGPALATFAAGWLDAAAGTMRFDVLAADLAALDDQPYPVRVDVFHDGEWATAWEC